MNAGRAHAQTPLQEVSGQAITAAGHPIAGATIVLQSDSGTAVLTATDAAGRFRLAVPLAGGFRLSASAAGFSPVTQRLVVPLGGVSDVTLVLPEVFLERVNVVGDGSQIDRIPGSAFVIDRFEMDKVRLATDDIHSALRQVPGLNIQEEDGYGLRPNIGMRGTGTDRSSKITMMEDGVLIAPAPYAAPAAYYSPTFGRMESLEVRKGSSQVKYGPNTTGGVLNYVSRRIPSDFQLRGSMSGGGDATRKITLDLGDAYRNFGWLVETFQLRNDGFKRLDGGGDTGVDLSDHMVKLRFNTTPRAAVYQELELKLGRTEQTGDETYLGLTDADFAVTPVRRYAASQMDVLNAEHTQYQVRHVFARRSWDVTTLAYRNNFHRAWYKLESVLGSGLSAVLRAPDSHMERMAVLTGADSTPNALVVRNNNRTYYGAGVQSVLGLARTTGSVRHQLEAGVRYHHDQEDRFQQDDGYQMTSGRMVLTRSGAPGSQANQLVAAGALAIFAADSLTWGRWTATPGVRYETIDLDQRTYARTDPDRTGPPALTTTTVHAVIPGVGLGYGAHPGVSVFAGVHKGFAPPGPGAAAGTRVEHSVNYELGTRVGHRDVRAELAGFFNDYGNLLGRDTLATGGTGDGQLFNGGKARVYGLEAAAGWSGPKLETFDVNVPVRLTYTYTQAEFRSSFQSQFGPWGSVERGHELPYVPRHQLHAAVDLDHPAGRLRLDGTYVGRMRTTAGQGAYLISDSTDAYWVLGLSGEYGLTAGARLFASVQNLSDHLHVVARHPAGVRPGLPRLMQIGVKIDLRR